MAKMAKLSVFLCHASEDKPAVKHLAEKLSADGFDPWLDEAKLLTGQNWDHEIRKALQAAHAVIACLSRTSVKKEGYIQKELRRALEIADEKPTGTIFLLPVKLDACEIPPEVQKLHWTNLFDGNGYRFIVEALSARAEQLGLRP
jgi:TIR domain